MKRYVKKYIPKKLKSIIVQHMRNRMIKNFFNQNHSKNALLSYITTPFKKESLAHTNYYEARSWAKILDELGYNVDIIHFERTKNINVANYDLICGFGDVFQTYFESGLKKRIVTIFYGTGMHVCHQNHATLNRVKDVYHKKGVWLAKSARFVEKTWTHQTTLVDGLIALGNEACAETYRRFVDKKVYSLNAPFYQVANGRNLIENRLAGSNKGFVWFGSSGLIHKGLDLVLEFFKTRPDLTLHVCGSIYNEEDFINVYKKELFESQNIHVHGFVDLNSDTFKEILQKIDFVIFPSCSEGGGVAVVTAIGNGGLIPIISKETSVSTGYEIWIDKLTVQSVRDAVENALSLSESTIKSMQKSNLEYVLANNSQEKYYDSLKQAITQVIEANTNEM